MLTMKQLKDMKPDTIFASGLQEDSPAGLNMTNSGKMLRWVAIRGGIHDWAIYVSWDVHPDRWVAQHGDKVHGESNIRMLVACDDEAFGMYRH